MLIPHLELSATTLAAIVLELVTRDGTDNSPVDARVNSVLRQLDNGQAELHFDSESQTCSVVSARPQM